MKIKKLTITDGELAIAVGAYLKTQGVSVPVESVGREYSYSSDWTVELKLDDEKPVPAYPPLPNVTPTEVAIAPSPVEG
jgi:hypothetical protein